MALNDQQVNKGRNVKLSEVERFAQEHRQGLLRSMVDDYHEQFLNARAGVICALIIILLGPLFALDVGNSKLAYWHWLSGTLMLLYPTIVRWFPKVRRSGVHYYDFICLVGVIETFLLTHWMQDDAKTMMAANDYLGFNLFLFSFLAISGNMFYLFCRSLILFGASWLLFYSFDPQLEILSSDTLRHLGQTITYHAAGIVTSIFIAEGQKYKFYIKRQQEYVSSLLDSIEEGVFRIGEGFKIEAGYSLYMHELFPGFKTFEGVNALDLLFWTKDGEEWCAMAKGAVIAAIGEDELAFQLNAHLLPSELHHVHGKVLLLRWKAIVRDGVTREIQVTITDATERRRLAQAADEERIRYQRIAKLLPILTEKRDHLLLFMTSFGRRLAMIREAFVRIVPNHDEKHEALRDLHTLKGEARSLRLDEISKSLHSMENHIRKGEIIPLVNSFEKVTIEAHEFADLAQSLGDLNRSHQASSFRLLDLALGYFDMVEQCFKRAGLPLPHLEIVDKVGPIENNELLKKVLKETLIHGLNNAADHGFILPYKNHEKSFADFQGPHIPHFRIAFERTADNYRLILDDSGFGLNWTKINALCEKQNFQPEPGRPKSDVLWVDGITTASSKSISSGQGLGASVIYSSTQEQGGTCTLDNSPLLAGTRLEIEIPLPKELRNSEVA